MGVRERGLLSAELNGWIAAAGRLGGATVRGVAWLCGKCRGFGVGAVVLR